MEVQLSIDGKCRCWRNGKGGLPAVKSVNPHLISCSETMVDVGGGRRHTNVAISEDYIVYTYFIRINYLPLRSFISGVQYVACRLICPLEYVVESILKWLRVPL